MHQEQASQAISFPLARDGHIIQSGALGRSAQNKGEHSPQTSKHTLGTPFFCNESTDHKYHFSGHSVKEFSLGKPLKYSSVTNRPRSNVKKRELFKNDEGQLSKDSGTINKENMSISELYKHLEDLKRIRDEYMKIVESEAVEKTRFCQFELKVLAEDVTLPLGDETRINQSFIHESHGKTPLGTLQNIGSNAGGMFLQNTGTPTKANTPNRMRQTNRSNQKLRRDESICIMTNSHIINSAERGERQTHQHTPDKCSKMSDSIFLKSTEFPRMIKKKQARNYTKVLMPVLVAEDSAESDRTVLDLYQLDKKVREEGNLEYFEGTCLIKSNRRTVVIKKTTDQRLLMKEIQAQLIFYENEYDFGKRCLNKMRDYFCLRGEYYVVYDKGGEMISYLDNNRKITDIQLLQMASDLSKALGSLHALGLVHAKLNPDSVSFTYDSVANTFSLLLTDFDRSYFEPSSAMSIGSGKAPKIEVDSCSSPELIFGGLVADRKSDYWSAGCLLFFIATGKQMFPSNSKSGLAYMIDKLNLDGSNMLKKLHPMAAQYIDKMSEEHKLDFDDSLLAVRELLRDLQVARSQTYQIIVDCLRISPQER